MPQTSVEPTKELAVPADKKKKPRHRQWGSATLWLLAGLAGLLGGRLGQLYPVFDVFSQFSAQFMVATVAFSFAIFLPRYKTVFGMAATFALLAAYSAWPHAISRHLQQPPYATQPGELLLRVAHFNTYKNNPDTDAIAAEILRLDADVVSLVEMSWPKKKALLPKLLKAYPNQYDCSTAAYCDIAIVSKLPILSAEGLAHWAGPPFARISLGGAWTGVSFFAVHTTRFPHSRAQLKQVEAMAKLLEINPGENIVAGDFNATPFSRVTTSFETSANLIRMTDLPTWPTYAGLPQLSIDHIFASGGFRLVGRQQIGQAGLSDHYPILLTLAFKPKP